MENSNIDLLRKVAEPYGIQVKEVPRGEGGLVIGDHKLSTEEAMKILFEAFTIIEISKKKRRKRMNLETLQNEMIMAMKNKDKERKNVIAGLVDAVKKASITDKGRVEITEDLVAQVLLKEQKTIQEMIATCPESRPELLTEYHNKLNIVNEFAPRVISDPEEVRAFIQETSDLTGMELVKSNRGKFMNLFKGKLDMKVANQILGEMIE